MPSFEPTQSSHEERRISEERRDFQIGQVTKIWEHTEEDDDSNFEANLILRDEEKERRRVPIAAQKRDEIQIPEEGDLVLVSFLDGDSEYPVVSGYVYNTQQRPPLGKEGMRRLRQDDLYYEVQAGKDESDSEVKWMRMAKKPADDEYEDLPATIEINDSPGEDTVIKVKGNESGEMGLLLNLTTGEFKISDGSQYGIVSDGSGNFTWYGKSWNFKDDGSKVSW